MEKSWFLLLVLVSLMHYCIMATSAMTKTRSNLSTDQSALLALKASITSPDNILALNWSTNSTTSCCNWIGVTCGIRHQRVTAINLVNMKLTGTISPHLGNLSFLTSFNVGNNSFEGEIPSTIDKCRRLQNLILSYNKFSGTIPREIGNLTMLKELHLSDNNFAGIIPQEISNLVGLKILSISKNGLKGFIPSAIFNISSIEIIDLSYNNLSGTIPNTSWKQKQLRVLSLSYNQLEGRIPIGIGNLTAIKQLLLAHNNFTGAIPQELGNLLNLESIILGANNLSGPIPSKIFNISTLETISLTANYFSGQLPPTIGLGLPNLKRLHLYNNELSGVIPRSISNASELIILDLSYNSFAGFIPDTLGNLKHLQVLSVGDNSLIPDSSTPELSFLASLTNCQQLRVLAISRNVWNRVLPIFIGNFSTLESFYAVECNLKGNLPREVGNLSNLITLSLEGNELTGLIPPTVGRLKKLQLLALDVNKFEGSIPYDLCFLPRLVYLYLLVNELSGPIPACIGNLTSLQELRFNSNKLTSVIPSTLWSLANLLRLDLSSNFLSGDLPLDIENLKGVTYLYLARNYLSGNIPSSIGNLPDLARLMLGHNRLQGPIPETLGGLIDLEWLDLSDNKFSGVIPKSLEKLRYLTLFNVSFNSLQGEIPNAGSFANFSAESFMMNEALCGAPRLQVPPCKVGTPRRLAKTVELLLKYVLPALVVTILILIFVLIKCRKKKIKNPTQTDSLSVTWRRISYQEIMQATDRFSESNLLGNGSFGSVYKGILLDGVIVAIKVFKELEGAFKSFDVECEVFCNIRHRNLIKVISSCSNQLDFKALILEYMPNGSLEKWLYSHNYFLDIRQRLNIMIDVALALEYLHHDHSTPIVHCDLKPSNILLDEDLVAHVGDFGISKLLGEGELMTQTITLATVGYMAPEYGSEGIVSTKGDVYSYGILLMETFTKKKPTDEMFSEEMSLKQWVKKSPHATIEIADGNLLRKKEEHFSTNEECISSVMELALDCSAQLPEERINIKQVLSSLNNIKTRFEASVAGRGGRSKGQEGSDDPLDCRKNGRETRD